MIISGQDNINEYLASNGLVPPKKPNFINVTNRKKHTPPVDTPSVPEPQLFRTERVDFTDRLRRAGFIQ